MKTQNIIFPLLILAISFLAGCIGQWQNPNAAIPAQEIEIRNLLVMPTIYDNAGVILEGKVWDLDFVEDKDNPDEVYSTFKLADKDGNYVIVRSPGMTTLLQEGAMIKVIGLHKIIYDKDSRLISNHIEAKQIIL
ncbi:MAG: hypothetical protein E2O67_00420 [Deltaproteobacteria bacterium]|nr:MAG: hypothetical protein E2O29_00260 [Deltaproteobacteria bacterium]TDJ09096.1 MAG: hypothetical protein E2O67_00420 [Deltaproteobacteria bacterium]